MASHDIDAQRVMTAALRDKTEAQRLAIAHGMWKHARDLLVRTLQAEHPDWSDGQIQHETARRLSHGAV